MLKLAYDLLIILTILCYAAILGIHKIQGWEGNMYLQAIHDCLLCSLVMFVGSYLAGGDSYKIETKVGHQKYHTYSTHNVGVFLCQSNPICIIP